MPASLYVKDHSLDMAIFDSFSRTTIRNLGRNEMKKIYKRNDHELGETEVLRYVADLYEEERMHNVEHIISDAHGHSCIVTTEWLYEAMLNLSESQKEVLILEFWEGMTISDIADIAQVSERTIYKRKSTAFKSIRSYYEREKK